MKIYRFLKFRKLWIRLLVYVVMCGIATILLLNYSSKYLFRSNIKSLTISHHKQHLNCDAFDPRLTPKHLFQSFFSIMNDSLWLSKPASYSPSFQELHSLLFGPTAPNLYEAWPNYFKKKADSTYPHTALTQSLFT